MRDLRFPVREVSSFRKQSLSKIDVKRQCRDPVSPVRRSARRLPGMVPPWPVVPCGALAVGPRAIPRYTPPMPKRRDPRPPVAIGHVSIAVRDVAAAARWFAALGLREIAEGDGYAVLELRGGTHLVVERAA